MKPTEELLDGTQIRKAVLEEMQLEATRFKLSAVYNESKRVMQLLEQAVQTRDSEANLFNGEFG